MRSTFQVVAEGRFAAIVVVCMLLVPGLALGDLVPGTGVVGKILIPIGNVAAEYSDNTGPTEDPNGLPPPWSNLRTLILDTKAYTAPECSESRCDAGSGPNEFTSPVMFVDPSGERLHHYLTPGLMRFQAVYGFWEDKNDNKWIEDRTDAADEWDPAPADSMMVFVSPGHHPTIYSDQQLDRDSSSLVEADWGYDFELRHAGNGVWTSAPVLFTNESVIRESIVTTVANGDLSFWNEEGYSCWAREQVCRVDIDRYSSLSGRDAADLFSSSWNQVLGPYQQTIPPMVDPILYDTAVLVNRAYYGAVNAYGTRHTNEANYYEDDPYASMTWSYGAPRYGGGYSFTGEEHAWTDIELAAYAPTPSEATDPGSATYANGDDPTRTESLLMAISARTGLWYDANYDGWIGTHGGPSDVTQDYSSDEFAGSCQNRDLLTDVPVPIRVRLEPVNSRGEVTNWGPTGAFLLQDDGDFISGFWTSWIDETVLRPQDRQIFAGPVDIELFCDPNDPGQWIANSRLFLPLGTFGFHVRVTQHDNQALSFMTLYGDRVLEASRDVDFVQHGLSTLIVQPDNDESGYGDEWERSQGEHLSTLQGPFVDQDEDLLKNIDEFRWLTLPLLVLGNAKDYDRDNWEDGPEVAYWNNPDNDLIVTASSLSALKIALTDPDFAQDDDGNDNFTTTHDHDSDNDRVKDGDEYARGTYPEFADSDCADDANGCPTPAVFGTTWRARADPRAPGTGDGLDDRLEKSVWYAIGTDAWDHDWDGDGIHNNLLDPDSDGDELNDSLEFNTLRTLLHTWDTDRDGLLDGGDVTTAATDPRSQIFHGSGGESNITYTDLPDGGRRYRGESGVSNANGWDTDGDGLPDGWEARFGADATALDPGTDLDSDGLNNAQEYENARPDFWDEAAHGAWWYGTYPLTADTDGDGPNDGAEVNQNTDPRDGMSAWPGWTPDDGTGGRWTELQSDSAINQDVPEEDMDPTNLYYLKNNVVDASDYAEEPPVVDQVAQALVDAVTAAAIRRNVTEALDILYNETPIASTVHETATLVNATEEAVLALVKCGDLPGNLSEIDPDWIANTLEGANATQAVDNATACVASSLTPFLDHLLAREIDTPPDPQTLLAPVIEHTLPGVVSGAIVLTPDPVFAAEEELATDPVPAFLESAMEDPTATDASIVSSAISESQAKSQVFTDILLPATNRHPQLLYDTMYAFLLDVHWPAVQAADEMASQTTNGEVEPISTIDSLAFNLYTEREGNPKISRGIAGNRTCIRLDTTTTTRDINGCDAYATLTVSGDQLPAADGATGPGWRVTPTLRLERARNDVNFDLFALAYLQVLNSPHIIALGYETSPSLGSGSGMPAVWEGSIAGYDTRDTPNRAMAVSSRHEDSRTSVPLHVVAGAFRVDPAEPGKPVVPGYGTTFQAASAAPPRDATFNLRAKRDPAGVDVAAFTSTNAMPVTWDVTWDDQIPNRQTRFYAHAALPAGPASIIHTGTNRAVTDLEWSSAAAANDLDLAFEQVVDDLPHRAFQLVATEVPGSFAVLADTDAHRHSVSASDPPGSVRFLLAEGASECPRHPSATHTLYVDRVPARLCAAGVATGDTSLMMTADALGLRASGRRPVDDAGSLVLVARDGSDIFLSLPAAPAAWDGIVQPLPNGSREMSWTASGIVASLRFDGRFVNAEGRMEDLRMSAATLPSGARATFDLATDRGLFHSPAGYGSIDLSMTSTGRAPTLLPTQGGDFFRVRALDASARGSPPRNYEAALHLAAAPDVVGTVLADGGLRVTAVLPTARPIHLGFEGHGYSFNVQTSSLSGTYTGTLYADDAMADIRYLHDADLALSSMTISGRTPSGLFGGSFTNVPPTFTMSASPRSRTLDLSADGVVGSAELRYASHGLPLSTPVLHASNFIAMRTTTEGKQILHAKIVQATGFSLREEATSLTLAPEFAVAGGPTTIQFEQPAGRVRLDLSSTPSSVTITDSPTTFTWGASEGGKSFSFSRTRPNGEWIAASASAAPMQLEAGSPGPTASAFAATLTHGGPAPLPSFSMTMAQPSTQGQRSWRLAGGNFPTTTEAIFQSSGDIVVHGFDSEGVAARVGLVDIAFSTGRAWIPAPPDPWARDLVVYEATADAAHGLAYIRELDKFVVQLQAVDSTGPFALLNRADTDRDLGVTASAAGTSMILRATTAPGLLRVSLDTSFSEASGFRNEVTLSEPASSLAFYYSRGNLAYYVNEDTTTPLQTHTQWQPGSSVHVETSSLASVSLGFSRSGSIPWASTDFVALRQNDAGFELGASIKDIQRLDIDPNARTFHARAGSLTRPLRVDVTDSAGRANVFATDIPASLTSTWDALGRSLTVDTSLALGGFAMGAYAASAGAGRIYVDMEQIPPGVTSFSLDPGTGRPAFTAAGSVGRLIAGGDNGNTGPLQQLASDGLVIQQSSDGSAAFLRFSSVVRIGTIGTDSPQVEVERSPTAAPSFAVFKFTLPDRALGASVPLTSGLTRIEWPSLTGDLQARILRGVGVGDATLTFVGQTRDRLDLTLRGAPADWSVMFRPDGTFTYASADGASRATSLDIIALRQDFGVRTLLTGVPPSVELRPANGFAQGTFQTLGGNVGRLTLVVGPAPEGRMPTVNAQGRQTFALDTTGAAQGALTVDLPEVLAISWDSQTARAGGMDLGGGISLAIERAAATYWPTVLQVARPDHATRVALDGGLPAVAQFTIARAFDGGPAVLGYAEALGKNFRLQHQDANGGSLVWSMAQAPLRASMLFAPTLATGTLLHSATAPVSWERVEARWADGYIRLEMSGVPTFLVMHQGPNLQAGRVHSGGTGPVGTLDMLFVRDSSQATINRFISTSDFLAVETGNSAPYAAMHAHGSYETAWEIPDGGGPGVTSATLSRATERAGATLLVLTGPGDDVFGRVLNAPSGFVLSTQASGGTTSPAPFRSEFTPGSGAPQPSAPGEGASAPAVGGTRNRVDIRHVNAESGEAASVSFVDVTTPIAVEVTGDEPGRVTIDSGDQPVGRVEVTATDRGNSVYVDAQTLAGNIDLSVERTNCVAAGFVGKASGTAKSLKWRLADGRPTTLAAAGTHVIANCDAGEATVSLETGLPPGGLEWNVNSCNSVSRFTIPVTNLGTRVSTRTPHGNYVFDIAAHDLEAIARVAFGPEGFRYDITDGIAPGANTLAHLLFEHERAPGETAMDPAVCFGLLNKGVRLLRLDATELPSTVSFARDVGAAASGHTQIGITTSGPIGDIRVEALVDAGPERDDSEFCADGPDDSRFELNAEGVQIGFLDIVFSTESRREPESDQFIFEQKGSDDYVHLAFTGLTTLALTKRLGTRIFEDMTFEVGSAAHRPFDIRIESPADRLRLFIERLPTELRLNQWTTALAKTIAIPSESIPFASFAMQTSGGRNDPCSPVVTPFDPALNPPIPPTEMFVRARDIPAVPTHIAFSLGLRASYLLVYPEDGHSIGEVEVGWVESADDSSYLSFAGKNVGLRLGWDMDGYSGADGNPRYLFLDGGVERVSLRIRFGDIGIGIGFGQASIADFQVSWYKPISWLPPVVKRTGAIYGGGISFAEVCVWGRWYAIPNRVFG